MCNMAVKNICSAGILREMGCVWLKVVTCTSGETGEKRGGTVKRMSFVELPDLLNLPNITDVVAEQH